MPEPTQDLILLDKFIAFVNAESWPDSKLFVAENADLLAVDAIALFEDFDDNDMPPSAAERVRSHIRLLNRCREIGIDPAFAEHILTKWELLDAEHLGFSPEAYLAHLWSSVDDAPELLAAIDWAIEATRAYHERRSADDLRNCIPAWRTILGDPLLPSLPLHRQLSVFHSAGNALVDAHARNPGTNDLQDAIELFRRALQAIPDHAVARLGFISSLGRGLRLLSDLEPLSDHLDEAIRILSEALTFTSPMHPDAVRSIIFLASCLYHRYELFGRSDDLNGAIKTLGLTKTSVLEDDSESHLVSSLLGMYLRARYELQAHEDDLLEAIRVLRESLRTTPPELAIDSPSLSALCDCMIVALNKSLENNSLEDAVIELQQSLEKTLVSSRQRSLVFRTLGHAYEARFRKGMLKRDLDGAIEAYRNATQNNSLVSPDGTLASHALAKALHARFILTGSLADLDEAIHSATEARGSAPEGWGDLHELYNIIAILLRERAILMESNRDFDESINLLELALTLVHSDPVSAARYQGNLGNVLSDRYVRSENQDDLERSIYFLRKATDATPNDSEDKGMWSGNLGNALRDRYELKRQPADLEDAIILLREALQFHAEDSEHLAGDYGNLASALRFRFDHNGEESDAVAATDHYRAACRLGVTTDPHMVLRTAMSWGKWAMKCGEWVEAVEALHYGLQLDDALLSKQSSRMHKESWLRSLGNLHVLAAYALAKQNLLPEAVVALERGKARLMSKDLRLPYQAAARGEEIGEAPYAGVEPDANATFLQIQQCADTPIAYLVVTPFGGAAIVVHSDSLHVVWLNDLSDRTVSEWLRGNGEIPDPGSWLHSYQQWLVHRTERATQEWFESIDVLTNRLWTHLMGPLASALSVNPVGRFECRSAVTIVPSGLLAVCPLHAAWTMDESKPNLRHYFLDDFAVNLVPSAKILIHVRNAANQLSGNQLLAIDSPFGENSVPLPNSHAEVCAIAALFEKATILSTQRATKGDTCEALTEASVAHFSCHGRNDFMSHFKSGLQMADEDGEEVWLTVEDIHGFANLTRRFASLSACETGIIGTFLPEEFVALPSALIQAGFMGVLASLWAVADISTAMLMENFYRRWQTEGSDPIFALRDAQVWVRDTTNREKLEYYIKQQMSPFESKANLAAATHFVVQLTDADPNQRSFSHPFWWSPFYLTGI